MLDVFKARLKAKTKAAGVNLSQKRIDAYADRLHKKNPDVKEEAEHDTLIDDLDELVSFADVAKEDDRVRTIEAKHKPKPAPKNDDQDDESDEEDDDEPSPSRKPKRESQTAKLLKQLVEKVDKLEGEKRTTSIKSKVIEKLKDKGVPEKYWQKWSLPDSEDKIDDFVTEIETGWTELKQDGNNDALGSTTKPAGGSGGSSTNVEKDIESWASSSAKTDNKK